MLYTSASSMSSDPPYVASELFRPALPYPDYLYDEMLMHTAQRFPEHTALLFRDVCLSYRELDALVNSCANALLSLGIQKGQTVCLFMRNRAEFIISWFAILRIGALACPLNPSYKEREVAYQLKDSEASVVICQHELLSLVEAVHGGVPTLRALIVVGSVDTSTTTLPFACYTFRQLIQSHVPIMPDQHDLRQEDLAALPYSSGTTGLPKGVMLTHKNLVYNVCQQLATGRLTEMDRLLVFLPLYHIYGLMLIGLSCMAGATIVLMERFEPGECLRLIQEQHITVLYAVPQTLSTLGDWPHLNEYDLRSIRYVQCGAAPVPPALARRFEERTHVTVMTSYGLTEASPATHSNPVHDAHLIKVETIGLPIHDTKQKIVDIETGEIELSVGLEGELIVQGPQVMQGYWKAPEATAEVLRAGWLYTGDIGWCDEQGYITLTDRKKELIKYKGFSVAPAQVEALLLEHPAVADVAVIGRPDAGAGEIPIAYVVLRSEHTHQDKAELLAWVNDKLATYKNVRALEFIATIPRNPSGKILRRVLKEQERQRLLEQPDGE
jgi:long-chain acyl-CoA synthetase